MSDFEKNLSLYGLEINNALDKALSPNFLNSPDIAPEKLIKAMRYGSLNGGKRLRPFLLSQSAKIFNIPAKTTIDAGLAIEMIHCYSLIHDDLPCMDDDDLRRGKPSVHKKFDEATAILAGDNLLTLAFEILVKSEDYSAQLRNNLIIELAKNAGAGGMVGGQMFDLLGENKNLNKDEIANISAMKTGALILASVRMGAIIGQADEKEIFTLSKYGQLAGRAFQLADDILDETASEKQMGKATGKDAGRGKSTLISLIGLKEAKTQLDEIIEQAIIALEPFGKKANGLKEIVLFFGARKN